MRLSKLPCVLLGILSSWLNNTWEAVFPQARSYSLVRNLCRNGAHCIHTQRRPVAAPAEARAGPPPAPPRLSPLWHRPLRRSASESGRLRHGDGAKKVGDRCPRGLKLAIPYPYRSSHGIPSPLASLLKVMLSLLGPLVDTTVPVDRPESTQTQERETGYRPGRKSVAMLIDVSSGVSEWSRCCPLHLDHPIISITRAYQCARNNWDFDPQRIERSSDAGGMDSLDTCNPCFQLNHVRGFQLRSIAHISHSGADLQRQCELGDVDVTIDITLTLANVGGEVVVLLHLNGRTARLANCTSEHILMFLVICAVLQAELAHGFAHFCIAQFVGRDAISPHTPILKEECSI